MYPIGLGAATGPYKPGRLGGTEIQALVWAAVETTVVYLDEAAFIGWLGKRIGARKRSKTRLRSRTASMMQLLQGVHDGRTVASRVPANGSRLQSISGRPRLVDVDGF